MASNDMENIIDPKILNKNLKILSLYIAVYESFKDTIVSNVKYFYWSGFDDGKEIFNGYEEKVLNKVKGKGTSSQLRATIKWFLDVKAITEDDCKTFREITDMRNKLVHEMFNILYEDLDSHVIELFDKMILLYEKIEKWWIKEIEIPIDPDITSEKFKKIDWENIVSVRLTMLKIMSDAAINENVDYLNLYKEKSSKNI